MSSSSIQFSTYSQIKNPTQFIVHCVRHFHRIKTDKNRNFVLVKTLKIALLKKRHFSDICNFQTICELVCTSIFITCRLYFLYCFIWEKLWQKLGQSGKLLSAIDLTFLQAHVIKIISINISDLFTKSCLQHFNVLVCIRQTVVMEHDIPNLYTFMAISTTSVEYIIVYKCFPDGISISIFHPNFAK